MPNAGAYLREVIMPSAMNDIKPTQPNRIYMDTIQSELNGAIVANLFKEDMTGELPLRNQRCPQRVRF